MRLRKLYPYILSAIMAGMLISCSQQSALPLSAKEFEIQITNKTHVQLIDVGTNLEYRKRHIKNADNIDFFQPTFEEMMGYYNESEPIYVYCSIGGRSQEAAMILKQMGFEHVFFLEGGIDAWRNIGLDLESS